MLSRRSNQALRDDDVANDGRHSRSGASTASHETSTAADSGFDAEVRYAPIRPRSQPLYQDLEQDRTLTPVEEQHQFGHPGFASLHQYNNSQGSAIDPQLAPSHGNRVTNQVISKAQRSNSVHSVNGLPGGTTQQSLARAPKRTLTSADGPAGTDGEKKGAKGQGNNQANEKELRELIEKNYHRTLESIARDVRNAERTQKSERAKQLFAMRWLREYCRHDTDSVPRNRVYTYYAQRCGNERVDILNAASFGKLVRVIFPGIQTRRLGVRGESKYHYVSLALVEDPNAHVERAPSIAQSTSAFDRATPFEQDSTLQQPVRLPADTAAFEDPEPSFEAEPLLPAAPLSPPKLQFKNPPSEGKLYAQHDDFGPPNEDQAPRMFKQQLRFTAVDPILSQDEPLELPDIRPYLPAKHDVDLADALTALNRTHCTSLVDSVRYVKEKQFVRLLGSFNGTMTVPVSRLFQQPSIAPWIQACDRVMYQQIIRFVSQLALQVIPSQVFTMLRSVSTDLVGHLQRSYGHHPEHVIQAKLEAATVFSSLLRRLLRVNETAHAAANLLMKDDMRNVMWQDWVKHVRPRRVVESALSVHGHEEVYKVLVAEMRHLLAPLAPADWIEFGTEYHSDSIADASQGDWLAKGNPMAESIIERWATFLRSLPGRFPKVPTKTVLLCVESIGNACLRDITVNQAQSFGAWWITKVWIDEMMLWMAEMGGFLDPAPIDHGTSSQLSDNLNSFINQNNETNDSCPGSRGTMSRPSSSKSRPRSAGLGIDFSTIPSFTPRSSGQPGSSNACGPPTATFRFSSTTKPNHSATTSVGKVAKVKSGSRHDGMSIDLDDQQQHDDSGIGMSLLEDVAPTARMGFDSGVQLAMQSPR